MIPPTKLQEAIYRFNTKLMHIWFIVSDYLPYHLISRAISRKASKEMNKGNHASVFVTLERARQRRVVRKYGKKKH